MAIVTILPQDNLRHIVRHFWYLTMPDLSDEAETYKILSDGSPGIIFQHTEGHSSVFDVEGNPLPVFFLYGQSTLPCINHIKGASFIFGINLQPAAFRELGRMNTSELTNCIVDAEYFFSGSFKDELMNTSDAGHIVRLFGEELVNHISKKYKPDVLIDESLNLIKKKLTEVNSDMLSSHLYISKRQLQRRFKEFVGVPPETYIRIIKFQKSICLLNHRNYTKLGDVGYRLNYADQSHFIRDFKMFSGYTPKEFIKVSTHQQPFYSNNNRQFEPLRILRSY